MNLWSSCLIVCPKQQVQAVNAAAKKELDPDGGEYTLTSPLSPTGKFPATHFWANTMLSPDGVRAVAGLATSFPKLRVWLDTAMGIEVPGNIVRGEYTPNGVLQELQLVRAN